MNRTGLSSLVLASGVIGVAAWVVAGPLNPPAGPVASTYKTLTEVEPRIAINAANTPGDADSVFRITTAGSYYLTGEVVAPAGFAGIEIDAAGVTLDLNGMRVRGPLSGAVAHGIELGRSAEVVILNGTIDRFMGSGVSGETVDHVRLERVRIASCREPGVNIGGPAVVRDCTFEGNGSGGVVTDGCRVGPASVVTGCAFISNTGDGLDAGEGSTVSGCASRLNTGRGFSVAQSSSVASCTALKNTQNGFELSSYSTIADCTALENSGGIVGSNATTIRGCTVRDSVLQGIVVGSGSNITATASSSNGGDGISVSVTANVTGCTVEFNGDDGITGSGQFTNNYVAFNFNDGIDISGASLVANNNCTSNGNGGNAANIRIVSFNCRVEGNTCANADTGILVSFGDNVIVRNTCSNNTTNFNVPANASVGTIFNIAGGIDITTSNSFANFEY